MPTIGVVRIVASGLKSMREHDDKISTGAERREKFLSSTLIDRSLEKWSYHKYWGSTWYCRLPVLGKDI